MFVLVKLMVYSQTYKVTKIELNTHDYLSENTLFNMSTIILNIQDEHTTH